MTSDRGTESKPPGRDQQPPSRTPPAGILLAAGAGTRFGGPKALVQFHGESLVRRGVRLLAEGGCAPVLVVVGADGHAVDAAVPSRWRTGASVGRESCDVEVRVFINPRWPTGMASSLQVGLDAAQDLASFAAGAAAAAVVALVDQPLVAPAAVERLIDAWRRGARIAVASYRGVGRNPVLFDAATWHAVSTSAVGDRGARALLRDRPEWVQRVACDAVASPADIDTPADLAALADRPDLNPPPSHADGTAKEQQQWN